MSESHALPIGPIIGRLVAAALALSALFFGTAGTLVYWEAWVYLVVLFLPTGLVLVYLARSNPALLERRLRKRERRTRQKAALTLAMVVILLAFVLPGLDRRFGWSDLPRAVVLFADLVFLMGYGLFFLVLRENSFASRVVEVEAGQQVVTTGPYRVVRHPMYVAIIVVYLASPLALGSIYGVAPALLLPLILVVRILDEERLLTRDLPGYREYQSTTKARLLPGIW
jgi:protein-S-isoprenylcysteine O-methyltransferase Ste14